MSLMNGLSAMGGGIAAYAGAVGLEAQKAGLARDSMMLADQLASVRESTGRAETAGYQAERDIKQNTFTSAQSDLDRQNKLTTTGMTTAAELERARITANTEPPETKNARNRALMTPEEKTAQDELMPGRARFSYQPSVQEDPENPGKHRSGVLRLDTHGVMEPQFIDTGTDPNKTGGANGLGNRAEIYFKRMVSAATLATEAAHNMMELPSSSSSGMFGGRHQGGSLFSALKEALVNTATTQEVQDYNVMVAGVARNLSAIETSGLAPSGSFTKAMDAVILKEGDSYLTKLRKMAEIRQIVVSGMEPNLADPKVPTEQKEHLLGVIDKMKKAIPFTHSDITALQNAKDPKTTLADVMRTNNLGGSRAAPDATSAAPAPTDPLGIR